VEREDKLKAFSKELALIKTPKQNRFAGWCIGELPDYFFTIPASSTGKYHPKYATGDGGLLRHTQAAVRIAYTLLGTETFGKKYTQEQKDMILVALIIHDGAKKGLPEGKHTANDHPNVICEYLEDKYKLDDAKSKTTNDVSSGARKVIYGMIRSHMGQWDADGTLPKPETSGQGFVHLCDYLASRKMLEFNFEAQI